MRGYLRAAAAGAALLALAASANARQGAVPKAYMVAQLTVTDTAAYAAYAPKVPPVVARFGGRYVVRGGAILPLEGTPPGQRVVVIEFASLEAAKAFYYSPEYQQLAPQRQAAATGPAFIVEGVAP
jgi:uncharacterized protein (DUF1330 family)